MIYCIALLIVCVNNFKELQVHSESDIIVIFTVSYTQTAAGLQVCLALIATTCNATAAAPLAAVFMQSIVQPLVLAL